MGNCIGASSNGGVVMSDLKWGKDTDDTTQVSDLKHALRTLIECEFCNEWDGTPQRPIAECHPYAYGIYEKYVKEKEVFKS